MEQTSEDNPRVVLKVRREGPVDKAQVGFTVFKTAERMLIPPCSSSLQWLQLPRKLNLNQRAGINDLVAQVLFWAHPSLPLIIATGQELRASNARLIQENEEEEDTLTRVKRRDHKEEKGQHVDEHIEAPFSIFPEWTKRDIEEELFFYPEDTLFMVRNLYFNSWTLVEAHDSLQDPDGLLILVKVHSRVEFALV